MMKPKTIAKAAKALSGMYTDSMDITEYTDDDTDPNVSVVKDTGIPCKISFKDLDSPDTHELDRDPIHVIPKIICGLDVPVAKGDSITAHRKGIKGNAIATYTGQAGLPAMFLTHQEFQILQEGQS